VHDLINLKLIDCKLDLNCQIMIPVLPSSLNLQFRPGYASRNRWNAPKYPVLNIDSWNKKRDLTFSLGRDTSYEEVHKLLVEAGCFKKGELLNYVKQLRITGNKENGQVFVECNDDGLTDDWVEKINKLNVRDTTITKCHAYTGKDVLVRFSCIHSNINVKKEIIDNFLGHFGAVKDHFPVKNKGLGVRTGPYMFVMRSEDLVLNPLPESIFIGRYQVWISYDGQQKVCHTCGKSDHISKYCVEDPTSKEKNFPTLPQGSGTASNFAPSIEELNARNAKEMADKKARKLAEAAQADAIAAADAAKADAIAAVRELSTSSKALPSASTGSDGENNAVVVEVQVEEKEEKQEEEEEEEEDEEEEEEYHVPPPPPLSTGNKRERQLSSSSSLVGREGKKTKVEFVKEKSNTDEELNSTDGSPTGSSLIDQAWILSHTEEGESMDFKENDNISTISPVNKNTISPNSIVSVKDGDPNNENDDSYD